MKTLFKWIITIKLEIGTEITTTVTTDSIKKAYNAMEYTAKRLNGEIVKIERDAAIKNKECSSNK